MIWTDEKVTQLKFMWGRGESASVIAAEMGISRSATLGKVHRLRLPHRRTVATAPYIRVGAPRSSRAKAAILERAAAKLNLDRSKRIEPTVKKFNIKTPLPELTKGQLRAMLKQAVINTAAMT